MDWSSVLASKSAEEEETSMLTAGFAARMRKRAANLKDEPAPISDRKRPRRSFPDEDAQKD